jgi:polar amino acid transport system substrate-binding protein
MIFNKKILFSAMAVCCSLVTATHVSARDAASIKKTGVLIVATEGQFAPFNYFQGSKLSGFEVELTELVAKKMGVALDWKTLSFDGLLPGLKQDRWDLVIASHGITDERSKAVTFTDPHYCSGGAIVSIRADVRTAKDLIGKTVSVQTGTTYSDNITKVAGVKEVKTFPQDSDARAALMTQRVDAWVSDRFNGLNAIKANPRAGMVMGDLIFVEKIAAAVAKGNAGLADEWNKALKAVMVDGSYAKLSKQYFGEDIRCKP